MSIRFVIVAGMNEAAKQVLFLKSRRIILAGLTGIIILLLGLYLNTPSQIIVSKTILIKTNSKSLSRFLSDDIKRDNWWATFGKAKTERGINIIQFQPYYLTNAISVKIKIEGNVVTSEMRIIPADTNSSYLKWQFVQSGSKNPVNKIQSILNRNVVEKHMQQILVSLKDYTEKSENIYGFKIIKTKVEDTILVVTKSILNEYPATSYIYNRINMLKEFIKRQQVNEKNFPMFYVEKTEKGLFETTIALPVTRVINNSETIFIQHMIPGDILYTECKGGRLTISRALKEMENYMEDYGYSSPAMPFELLVTDRVRQPDTSKWITKIYSPVY